MPVPWPRGLLATCRNWFCSKMWVLGTEFRLWVFWDIETTPQPSLFISYVFLLSHVWIFVLPLLRCVFLMKGVVWRLLAQQSQSLSLKGEFNLCSYCREKISAICRLFSVQYGLFAFPESPSFDYALFFSVVEKKNIEFFSHFFLYTACHYIFLEVTIKILFSSFLWDSVCHMMWSRLASNRVLLPQLAECWDYRCDLSFELERG